jgi:hypothetical protein
VQKYYKNTCEWLSKIARKCPIVKHGFDLTFIVNIFSIISETTSAKIGSSSLFGELTLA